MKTAWLGSGLSGTPTPHADGATIYAADLNNYGDDQRKWGGDVSAEGHQLLNLAAPVWHEVGAAGEPTFQNSWVNTGGAYHTLAFCKDLTGLVRIIGTIKSGTTAFGTLLFTLPVGYRPTATVQLLIGAAADGSGNPPQLLVSSDGACKLYYLGGSAGAHVNGTFPTF